MPVVKNLARRMTFMAAALSMVCACALGMSACGTSDAEGASGSPSPSAQQSADAASHDEGATDLAEGAASAPQSEASAVAPAHPEGSLKVHFVDVGQGDCEFLELPNGQTMLIDAGERDEAQTVIGYMQQLGYSRIDYVVATHPHSDHIGAMAQVIRAFDVGQVWAPRVSHNTKTFEAFLDAVSEKGLGIETAMRGKQVYAANGCTVDVLSPAEGATYDDLNDWSVVLKLNFGDQSFLFTGDAGAGVIAAAQPGHASVLKVAHHGSRTSTDTSVVAEVSPEFAVIDCGAGNSYGHPHEEALQALDGITLYRTDVNGTVTATCNGGSAADIFWETGVTTPRAALAETEATAAAAGAGAAAATAGGAAQSPAPDEDGTTVYITDTGKKYHLDGCSSLSKSKHAISLSDAKAQGYGACKRCNPPA